MDELKVFIQSRQKLNLIMVLVNIVVFLLLSVIGNTGSASFMLAHGAAYTPYIFENGEYYRLFSSMFLHFGIQHLVYNMLLLIFLGDSLEKLTGKVRYLIIYLLGGLAGNLLSAFIEMHSAEYKMGISGGAVSAGASGAIFAVLGAMVWIVFCHKGRIAGYSMKRLLIMVALSVAEGFTSSGVDAWAHLGGLLGGLILAILLYRPKET